MVFGLSTGTFQGLRTVTAGQRHAVSFGSRDRGHSLSITNAKTLGREVLGFGESDLHAALRTLALYTRDSLHYGAHTDS